MKSKRGKGEGRDRRDEQSPGAPGEDDVSRAHSVDDAGKDEVHGERGPHEPGEDKVIRLPRDWLGPREELVPFGPSADRQEPHGSEPPLGQRDGPDDASARPPLEEVAPLSPEPVSPDDFWGERSAALQGPLDEADRDAVVGDESGPTRRRRRGPVVAAAAAALVAVALVSLSLLGQSSSGPGRSRVSADANSGGGGTVDSGGGRGTLWPLPAHAPLALHRPGRSGHGRSKLKRSTLPHRSASVAVNYVRQPASTQSTAGRGTSASSGTGSYSAPASASNASPTTVSVPTSSSGTTATNSGATSAATTTSPTTPTSANGGSGQKARAFGASGALGPGHSGTG